MTTELAVIPKPALDVRTRSIALIIAALILITLIAWYVLQRQQQKSSPI